MEEVAARVLAGLSDEASAIGAWLERGELEGGLDENQWVKMACYLDRWIRADTREGILRIVVYGVFIPSQAALRAYNSSQTAGRSFAKMMIRILRGSPLPKADQVEAAKQFFRFVAEAASTLPAGSHAVAKFAVATV